MKSLYLLRKFLVSQFPAYHPIRIPYCSVCLGAIENHGENEKCYGALKYEFVLSDIGMQLKEKFKGVQCNLNKGSMNKLIPLCDIIIIVDSEFWCLLKLRPDVSNSACMCDIHDGRIYAEHSNPGGFLNKTTNPANLSFMINTDGVALFRSSNKDIWPIFLTINELPPSVRSV